MIFNLKKDFIDKEIFILAWGASVQHNAVYNPICSIENRSKFREDMRLYLINNILPKYRQKVTDENHCNNIIDLKQYAEKIGENTLLNKNYKIGTSQKLLNLSLKYFWCMGLVAEPPHCPVDRIILDKVKIKKAWTQINTIQEYKSIVSNIRKKINRDDLSQWELESFKRKN